MNVSRRVVLVTGGRDYRDTKALVPRALDLVMQTTGEYQVEKVLVHGDASGADSICAAYAKKQGWTVVEYPADWEKHGRAAGPIRNQKMLDEEQPDVVVAFPGGSGTEDMVRRARKAGVLVLRVEP